MNILSTKTADQNRLIRGISLDELKEVIEKGIKTRQGNTILSSYNNIVIFYNKKSDNYIINNVASKWSVLAVMHKQ